LKAAGVLPDRGLDVADVAGDLADLAVKGPAVGQQLIPLGVQTGDGVGALNVIIHGRDFLRQ
jgi:hypothetical protein